MVAVSVSIATYAGVQVKPARGLVNRAHGIITATVTKSPHVEPDAIDNPTNSDYQSGFSLVLDLIIPDYSPVFR